MIFTLAQAKQLYNAGQVIVRSTCMIDGVTYSPPAPAPPGLKDRTVADLLSVGYFETSERKQARDPQPQPKLQLKPQSQPARQAVTPSFPAKKP